MKIVLLSGHFYNSKRKAGFHFIADSLKSNGYDVTFITIPFSLFSFIKNDFRIREDGFMKNLFHKQKFKEIDSLINFTLFHPIKKGKLIEAIGIKFFSLNKNVIKEIINADIVLFESTIAILFFEKIKKLNTSVKTIYRMSDDIELLNLADMAVKYEKKILPYFDIVSVPTKSMYDKFIKISPENLKLHYHGIDKDSFDKCDINPYKPNTINIVFVGNGQLDTDFIKIASIKFPNYLFHIIGPFNVDIKKSNVIYYGQMDFYKTIPYIKYSSIGLQIRKSKNKLVTSLADSLKVLQYSYCKLPIIAPDIIPAKHRKNFFYYKYNDEKSIENSIKSALKFDRNNFKTEVKTWSELSMDLINL